MKIRVLGLLAVLACAISVGVVWVYPQAVAPRLRVALEPTVSNALFMFAADGHWVEDDGLPVKILEFASREDALAAYESGVADALVGSADDRRYGDRFPNRSPRAVLVLHEGAPGTPATALMIDEAVLRAHPQAPAILRRVWDQVLQKLNSQSIAVLPELARMTRENESGVDEILRQTRLVGGADQSEAIKRFESSARYAGDGS